MIVTFFLQHPVLVFSDRAAQCVRALPVWRGQRHLFSGSRVLVWHRDGWQHTALQVSTVLIGPLPKRLCISWIFSTALGPVEIAAACWTCTNKSKSGECLFCDHNWCLRVCFCPAVQRPSLSHFTWMWTLPPSTQSWVWHRCEQLQSSFTVNAALDLCITI